MDTSAIQRQTMNGSSLDGLQVLRCVTVNNNDVGRFCLYVLHNTAAMLSSLYFKFYDTRLKVYFIITREVFVAWTMIPGIYSQVVYKTFERVRLHYSEYQKTARRFYTRGWLTSWAGQGFLTFRDCVVWNSSSWVIQQGTDHMWVAKQVTEEVVKYTEYSKFCFCPMLFFCPFENSFRGSWRICKVWLIQS